MKKNERFLNMYDKLMYFCVRCDMGFIGVFC